MANSSKTVICVPGSFHGPENFDLVGKKLQDAGYRTASVRLKSVGAEVPLQDFWPDVDAVRSEIKKAADAGQNVIVVAHSYGGIPASQAIEGFDLKSRAAAGNAGGVSRLFYCVSFLIPEGQSLVETFGGVDLPWWDIDAERTVISPIGPGKLFYNDMPDDLVQKCVSSLQPQSFKCLQSKLEWAAWKHGVPTTYLYALQDEALPLSIQKMMVKQFAEGYHIDTETVDAGHSPFFSKVDETVAAIRRAAGEIV